MASNFIRTYEVVDKQLEQARAEHSVRKKCKDFPPARLKASRILIDCLEKELATLRP